jgi:hypothetical protein
MSQLRFQVLEMRDASAREWLLWWVSRYQDETGDDPEYVSLIEKSESFSADDIRLIGKWKDNAWTEGKWKPNVAQVAYRIWEQAAEQPPRCPEENEVADFLESWSNREYVDQFTSRSITKRFGLSRATTLLHFLTRGRYPIFDSRVRTAIARLGCLEPEYTVASYMDCVPFLRELASQCGASDARELDKALFAYGALDPRTFKLTTTPHSTTPADTPPDPASHSETRAS